MFQSTPGSRYERAVFDLLRERLACEVFSSPTMDVRHKIDGEIRRIGGKQLKKPVQVQITKRVGHYGKLSAYMSSRWLNTDIISLYAEVHAGMHPRETADHLVWAAQATQEMHPYGNLPIFGLRIAEDDAVFFNPYARQQELLDELSSPERLATLRDGIAHRFEEQGFWIMEEGTNSLYHAHYIDVFDSTFRHRLRDGEARLSVRFLPVADARATDVRRGKRGRKRAKRG